MGPTGGFILNEQLRFASEDDAEALLAIYAPYVADTVITYEYEVPSVSEFRERIASIAKKFPYLVYEVDGQIVGYAYGNTFRTRAAFQWDVETSIYLTEDAKHKGIAKKLYDVLLALLRAQGFYHAYAYIDIPNEASTRFHKKLGFEEIAVYPSCAFKLGRWCTLSCMELSLTEITEDRVPSAIVPITDLDASLLLQLFHETTKEERMERSL